MYPPHHLGGYELTWHSSVEHLRETGHEVQVLTTDYRDSSPDPTIGGDGHDIHRELRWYWRDHEFPRYGLRARRSIERHNLAALARHLRGFAPDAVCFWAMGGMSLSLLEYVRRQRMPAVAVVGDDWLVYGPRVDAWQRAFAKPAVLADAVERATDIPTRLDLDHAARWLCVSERVRDRARAEGHQLPGAIIVNPGIDAAAFPASSARPWEWQLLYLGRVDARKGIATAVRALAVLPEARLRIVGRGDPSYLGHLRALVGELGLSDRVRFEHPSRDELAAIYGSADAVLFPVLWDEPWGLVPLEAMSVGRPVVATGTGGSGEYLRDGENCVLFHPKDDPTALAAAVRRLAGDRPLRNKIREGGFHTAARFDERRYNDAILAALEETQA